MINTVNTETRRKSERTKVASTEIVYVHFQTGNGAVALDVSNEGLGFQAADRLQPNESMPFRLSVPGLPEIALSGQIVWLDSTRKRGGMRLSVPAESLALFQKWQRKYVEPAPENAEIPRLDRRETRPPASQAAPRIGSKPQDRAPVAAPAATRNQTQPPDSAPAPQPEPPRTSPPPLSNPFARRPDSMLGTRGPIFVSEWELPPEPPRTGRNILVACVIIGLCIVIAGGSYYLAGKRAVGNMLINLGQQIGGASPQASATPGVPAPPPANTGSQAAPGAIAQGALSSSASLPQNASTPNPVANTSPASAPDVPPAAPTPQSQSDANGANPAAASSPAMPPQAAQQMNATTADAGAGAAKLGRGDTHNGSSGAAAPPPLSAHPRSGSYRASASVRASQTATAAADNGGADLGRALEYLRGPNSQDTAVAAELLWSAVGKGNTQADLVLGDLYMRGQGAVHRNCQQAEVLLHAALEANVSGAEEKIQELQTYGCR